jgi:hypothetical protein
MNPDSSRCYVSNDFVTHERLYPLALRYSCWSFSCRFLSPFRYLMQVDPMLYRWPFNDNCKFSHRLGPWDQRIAPETCNCKGYGFVKGFGVDVDAMQESVGIGERDAAACGPHAGHYTVVFAFCSPQNDRPSKPKPGCCNLTPVCSFAVTPDMGFSVLRSADVAVPPP